MKGQKEGKCKQPKLYIIRDRNFLRFRFLCQSLAVDRHHNRIPFLLFDFRFVNKYSNNKRVKPQTYHKIKHAIDNKIGMAGCVRKIYVFCKHFRRWCLLD